MDAGCSELADSRQKPGPGFLTRPTDFDLGSVKAELEKYRKDLDTAQDEAWKCLTSFVQTYEAAATKENRRDYQQIADEVRALAAACNPGHRFCPPQTLDIYDPRTKSKLRHHFSLFLTADQARMILDDGQPRISVLVPAKLDLGSTPLLDADRALTKLKIYSELTTHNFLGRTIHYLHARVLPTEKVIQLLQDKEKRINVVQRGAEVINSTPSFVTELDGWDYLPFMREDLQLSKPSSYNERDASLSVVTRYFSSYGSWTVPRIERGGFVISVRVEAGARLWISWPPATQEQLKQFGKERTPKGFPKGLLLRPGDTLIHPAGTPYASVAIGEGVTVTTITTFAPTQDLARQLECLHAEAQTNSTITNSDRAYDIKAKLEKACKLMASGNRAWPWPPVAEQSRIQQLMKVCSVLEDL
jgi:hypothetical protein